MSTSKNTFVSIAEQVALLNKNAVEILTQINTALNTQATSVNVNYIETDGATSTYQLPTVAHLTNEITSINNTLKSLMGFSGTTSQIISGNSTQKVMRIDIDREPDQIETLSTIASFTPVNNYFFESLLDPLLAVEIDLSDVVSYDVNSILSRRYIVRFDKNSAGELSTAGTKSLTEFKNNFINNSNIDYNTFINWFNNPTNTGVSNNDSIDSYELNDYDEQLFKFDSQQLQEFGLFTVLKQEVDRLNKKLWYHLNTLTYFTALGDKLTLAVDDELIVNNKNAATRYKIVEISTASSNYRVTLQRIEGLDPVPTGVDMLKFYSKKSISKKVKISIGYDEYNVIFLKPINTYTNIRSSLWSKGIAFYSNTLTLSTDSTINMQSYYLSKVLDYGQALKDLVQKTIPTTYGLTPNIPVLLSDNFKVVQINKHLTETEDIKTLKTLQTSKQEIRSKIDQVNGLISTKTNEINTKAYKTTADKDKAKLELSKLNNSLDSYSKQLNSIVSQITSYSNSLSVDKKYRVRGFWEMPTPQSVSGFRDQEIVQFYVQYRYSSKSGKENQTEGYQITSTTSGTTSSNVTGYFSNWTSVRSETRGRYYDFTQQKWFWEDVNISDADVINMNQLDITIQDNEKVEIRVKSVSEVGFPDSPLVSDWSDIMTIEFPTELSSTSTTITDILTAANEDKLLLEFQANLDAKGYTKHIANSYSDTSGNYIAHRDTEILTSFTDSNGNVMFLYDYIKTLTDKINSLEELINKTSGVLQISIFYGSNQTKIANGDKLQFYVNCEDYATAVDGATRTYYNDVYQITDYYLQIDNLATSSQLGLLSSRLYTAYNVDTNPTNTFYKNPTAQTALVDANGNLILQNNNQFIWFSDNYYDTAASQTVAINNSLATTATPHFYSALTSTTTNIAYSGNTNIINDVNWNYTGYTNSTSPSTGFFSTIHPNVNSIADLINVNYNNIKYMAAGESIKIPIYIYFKIKGFDYNVKQTVALNSEVSIQNHTKYLKVFLENSQDSTKPFEFQIKFQLTNKNNYKLSTKKITS